jgi:hypothetical protein
MKNQVWLKPLLLINGVMEGGFGIYLFIFPDRLSQAIGCPPLSHVSYFLVSRMYGLVALCLGILSLGLFIRRTWSDFLGNALQIFVIFHLGMAVVQFIDNPNWKAGLIHIIFGAAFLAFWLKQPSGRQETE